MGWKLARLAAAVSALTTSAVAMPAYAHTADAPRAMVAEGLLRGSEGDGIRRFFGIPFATPPVGVLRWKAPLPPQAWQGERDATQFGAICPQAMRSQERTWPQSEDCLTLNIWTPADAAEPLPVMVWIHGGGYMFGSGREPQFDGTRLAQKGVVLVTLNYRLGALGFMAHPELSREADYGASGNYGILDQIAALRWIRANVAAFGGDPKSITIFGESAGAGSVNILQASPLAKGLFDKAIGQSTSQFDPDGGLIGRKDLKGAEAHGQAFAAQLGADSLQALRALPAETIVSHPTFFWPTERDGHVLPDLVYNIFANGLQNDVPTLVGSNSDEGATIRMEWVKRDEADTSAYDRLYGGFADPLRQSATDAVQWQMRIWARLQAETGSAKAWLYWFDRAWPGRKQDGAFHGAEIVYAFQTLDAEDQPWTEADRRLSALMADYWVSFARDGDPNAEGLPKWPAYAENAPKLMRLSPEPAVIDTPRPEAQTFLDAYFDARR